MFLKVLMSNSLQNIKLIPDNIEASSFPPIAKIYLPIVVLVKINVDKIAKTISMHKYA